MISALGDSKQSIRAHQVYKEMQHEFLGLFFGGTRGGAHDELYSYDQLCMCVVFGFE